MMIKAMTETPTTTPTIIGIAGRWRAGLVDDAVCTDEVPEGGIDGVVVVAAALEFAGTVPFPMTNFWIDS